MNSKARIWPMAVAGALMGTGIPGPGDAGTGGDFYTRRSPILSFSVSSKMVQWWNGAMVTFSEWLSASHHFTISPYLWLSKMKG